MKLIHRIFFGALPVIAGMLLLSGERANAERSPAVLPGLDPAEEAELAQDPLYLQDQAEEDDFALGMDEDILDAEEDAFEEDEISVTMQPPVQVQATRASKPDRIRELEAELEKLKKQNALREKTFGAHFDAVPAGERGPLIERLDLVSKLVAKYSRAYDYRSLTTQELKQILADLERPATPKN